MPSLTKDNIVPMAALTQLILFVEMLKFSENIFWKDNNLWGKIKNIQDISEIFRNIPIFEMESRILIN
jgi:hypothetical protein